MFDPSYNSAMQQMGFGHAPPNCGKCGLEMTPENARHRPELFLHDDCLPDDLKPQGKEMTENAFTAVSRLTAWSREFASTKGPFGDDVKEVLADNARLREEVALLRANDLADNARLREEVALLRANDLALKKLLIVKDEESIALRAELIAFR